MTDNKVGRSVSNAIWGNDPKYTDNSYSRHFVHKTWHDMHDTEQDRKRSEMHKTEMERIRRDKAERERAERERAAREKERKGK